MIISNDNSKKILKNYKDKRIKYFKSNKYLKLYAARNKAISYAKGKYISFLDTDDLWRKDKIKKQIRLLTTKNCSVVYSNYIVRNEKKIHLIYLLKLFTQWRYNKTFVKKLFHWNNYYNFK